MNIFTGLLLFYWIASILTIRGMDYCSKYMKKINPIRVRSQNPEIFKHANLTKIIFSYLFVKDMQNFNFTNRTIYHTMQRVYTKEIEEFKQVTLYFLSKFSEKPNTVKNDYVWIDTEEIDTAKAAIKLLNILMCHGFKIFPIFDHILQKRFLCEVQLIHQMNLIGLERFEMELCYDSESAMFQYVSKDPKYKLKIPLFYLLKNQSWMPEPKDLFFSLIRHPRWSIKVFTPHDPEIDGLFNGEVNGDKIQYNIEVSVGESFFRDGDAKRISQAKKVPPKYYSFGENHSCKYICDNLTGYE